MTLFTGEALILIGFIFVLILLNALLDSLRPRNKNKVKVSFIPPANMPYLENSGVSDPRLDAHIVSTNQKFSQLHERVVRIEQTLNEIKSYFISQKEETPTTTKTTTENVTVSNTLETEPALVVIPNRRKKKKI